ncbi:hypothetical protein BC832DRAFT_566868 [Gaertneriomyces semiglobifer]|nr:hypothetical protein BC832DRAFT_566868 [Gaertneriomyces semiglobifer]
MSFALHINVYNETNNFLSKIPSLQGGRPLNEVLLVLSICCSPFPPNFLGGYVLVERTKLKSNRQGINPDPVLPGSYTVQRLSSDIPVLNKRHSSLHLIPTSADTPPTPTNASRKMGDVSDLGEQLTALLQSANFKLGLAQRDRACVVTQTAFMEDLEGSYVVPFAWGKHEGLLELLPDEVVSRCVRDIGGIDTVRNGILIETGLLGLFDRGALGIVAEGDQFQPGHYRAFGINHRGVTKQLPDGPLHGHKIPCRKACVETGADRG